LPLPVELDGLRVVLVGTRNPLNLGAAARAMSNFGFLRLRVVNPYDVAFREARSAMGAAPLLASAQEFTSVAEAVADCTMVVGTTSIQHRDLQHPIHRLDEGATLIQQHLASAPVALLFGSEKFGLSNDELSHCHWLVNIPTRDEHVSMNLGQAVAVTLYELVRGSKMIELPREPEMATAGDVERLTLSLLDALSVSGYATPATIAATEEKVRRLVRRMSLSGRDAELWLGMLRQILWKLRAAQPDAPEQEIDEGDSGTE
jgi:TrmH family RNA methyltransferase